jgi:hypothetical protein
MILFTILIDCLCLDEKSALMSSMINYELEKSSRFEYLVRYSFNK